MEKPWKANNGAVWPKCPECGSEDVAYENPRTGCGTYACCDCGHELTPEQAIVLERTFRGLNNDYAGGGGNGKRD